MTFHDVANGLAVFLDANTIVYAIIADPTFGTACTALLDRVEQQDIQGFCSAHVLSEVVHRVMTIEACDRFSWPAQGIANRLRCHPSEVQQLVLPRRAVDEIVAARVRILPVTAPQVSQAVDVSRQSGLLSGDALGMVQPVLDSGCSGCHAFAALSITIRCPTCLGRESMPPSCYPSLNQATP